MQKTGYHELTGIIHCKSGLRIGGSDEMLQIGGTDLSCIKHPITLKPYIPGSSIKGKLRSELEHSTGKFGGDNRNEPCGCAGTDCLVCRVFGPHKRARHELGPTRLVVRDAPCIEGGETELKAENVIDRKTGTAMHPRKVERVVAGSKFALRIGIHVWDLDDQVTCNGQRGGAALVEFLRMGLRAVRQTGLGSGISKGSGEIEFEALQLDGQAYAI